MICSVVSALVMLGNCKDFISLIEWLLPSMFPDFPVEIKSFATHAKVAGLSR